MEQDRWNSLFFRRGLAKKHINAFEELKNDEKNSRELLNSIFEVASKSLK